MAPWGSKDKIMWEVMSCMIWALSLSLASFPITSFPHTGEGGNDEVQSR